jgi:hypothetical protein
MYADLLSHLLIEEFNTDEKLILNIAELDSSTHAQNLEKAVEMARGIGQTKKVTCNSWKFKDDPLLSIENSPHLPLPLQHLPQSLICLKTNGSHDHFAVFEN